MVTGLRNSSFSPVIPFLAAPASEEGARESLRDPARLEESEPSDADGRARASPLAVREEDLTPQEAQDVRQLEIRDQQVRRHEQAHLAVAGSYAISAPAYQYVTGPDGKRYAVAGEVSISTSPEATPEETLKKAQVIRRAALAPGDPSPQDRRIAAAAARLEAQARRELAEQKAEEAAQAEETKTSQEEVRAGPGAAREEEPSRPPLNRILAELIRATREAPVGQILDLIG